MVLNEEFHILTIHFEPPKRGQPLYKGQSACMVPRYPLYGGSTLFSISKYLLIAITISLLILCIGNSSTVVIIYCVVFVIVLILSITTTG